VVRMGSSVVYCIWLELAKQALVGRGLCCGGILRSMRNGQERSRLSMRRWLADYVRLDLTGRGE
jgi:hypothetical protein